MNTIASVMKVGLAVTIAAFTSAGVALVASNRNIDGELLHTGMRITPTAASGAFFQSLNPGLEGLPDFTAGQAVSTALSPDGRTLLVLTSGYNRNNGPTGSRVAEWSNEYVFVYDVTRGRPEKRQVLAVPNTFNGIAWNPKGQEFYVSGGRDDSAHVFTRSGSGWVEQTAIDLGDHPNRSGNYQPMAAGIAVNSIGTRLVVANLLYDSVTVVDLAGRTLVGDVDLRPGVSDPSKAGTPGGTYPFWVVVKGADKAYVSSQRDREIVIVNLTGTPHVTGRIPVGGLPGKMILNESQDLLFVAEPNGDTVAIIDTRSDRMLTRILTTGPGSLLARARSFKGSNPNSLALSPDEKTLYVTNGGTNSLAVISLRYGRDRDHDRRDHDRDTWEQDDDDDDRDDRNGGNDVADGNPDGWRGSRRRPRITGRVEGLIPTGYYPNAVTVSANGHRLFVANGMSNTGPNPQACRDTLSIAPGSSNACAAANQYSWQLTKAGLLSLPVPSERHLDQLTEQVAYNNRMKRTRAEAQNVRLMAAVRRQIKHVIYVVKENRTYDQVFGDLPRGNGDPGLAILSPFSPNHKKLAMDFVVLDNFHDSGTVSGDGWNWSTAGRANDYTQKSVPVNYGGRGFSYDWEGANRNVNVSLPGLAERKAEDPSYPDDPNLLPGVGDVAAPDSEEGEAGTGYLWDSALRAGKTVRNYGFFVNNVPVPSSTFRTPFALGVRQSAPLNRALAPHTDVYFRGYDQTNADFWLFKEWEREFDAFVAKGTLPNLSFVRLPHDHFGNFNTAIDGVNTVETQMADNDYAVGLLVEKVARSPFRNNTLIFVVEDDAQNGGDHMDAHRSIALVVGPFVKRNEVVSTHYTTVSLIRTIVDVLGIDSPGLNDALAEPMADVFDPFPRSWSYNAIVPAVLRSTQLPLPPATSAEAVAEPQRTAEYWQQAMGGQNFEVEDDLDTDSFNEALWEGLKGKEPYPVVRHRKDLRRNRQALLKQHAAGRLQD